jgi:hypothetical protein
MPVIGKSLPIRPPRSITSFAAIRDGSPPDRELLRDDAPDCSDLSASVRPLEDNMNVLETPGGDTWSEELGLAEYPRSLLRLKDPSSVTSRRELSRPSRGPVALSGCLRLLLTSPRAGVAGLGIAVEVVNEGGEGGGPSIVLDSIGSL